MNRRIIIRPEAEREMTEAFNWYEERAPGLGAEFLLTVDAVLQAAARSPEQFPCIHQTVRRGLTRRFPYEVFFIEDNETISVLAVFHARRNPTSWQNRN